MPPKARPLRKNSTASQSTAKDAAAPPTPAPSINTSGAGQTPKNKSPKAPGKMLPPPDPVPATILGPEMQSLETSLKEAALRTGQIFRFHADARKQRIVSQAPYPPRSITRALGRSLERYDQICDTVETQLLHAISIFERDMRVEQARLDAEASASVATRTRSKRPSLSPSATRVPLPNASPPPLGSDSLVLTDSPTSMLPPSQFPPPSGASATASAPRRPSAIVSSLHRPSFPLKLDLSAAALAGSADASAMGTPVDVNVDLGLTSLPSPVTLVPKTARALPNDAGIPDIFGVNPSSQGMPDGPGPGDSAGSIPAPVGMPAPNQTHQEDVIDLTGPESSRGRTTAQLGDSADKPIELDLEGSYDDLFGDVPTNSHTAGQNNNNNNNADSNANVGGAVAAATAAASSSTQIDVDMEGLFTPQDNATNTFQLDEAISQNDPGPDPSAILASLASSVDAAGSSSNELSSLLPGNTEQSGNNDDATNQLAGQTSSASGGGGGGGDSFSGLDSGEGAAPQFDLSGIDLSSFSDLFEVAASAGGGGGGGGDDDMDLMSQLLAMNGGENADPSGGGGNNMGS